MRRTVCICLLEEIKICCLISVVRINRLRCHAIGLANAINWSKDGIRLWILFHRSWITGQSILIKFLRELRPDTRMREEQRKGGNTIWLGVLVLLWVDYRPFRTNIGPLPHNPIFVWQREPTVNNLQAHFIRNNRSAWRKTLASGAKEIDAKRYEDAKRRHDVRHGTTGEAATIQCNRCHRYFLHRIGLASHVRHHHPLIAEHG